MDFVFIPSGLGLRRRNDWKSSVRTEKCQIANERINSLMKEVADNFSDVDFFDIQKHSGTFRYAVIRATEIDSSISFVLNSDSMKINEAIERIKNFKTTSNNILVTYVHSKTDNTTSDDYVVIKGKDLIEETLLGKVFCFPIQGFFQNNHNVAEMMQRYVSEKLQKYETKDAYLLDLYAGVGTFGIMNSGLFKETTIVESVKPAIDCAIKNIEKNHIKNAQAICLDASRIKKLQLKTPLYVITDPPRQGMDQKTIEQLNTLKPEVIIYISCNIGQLRKDIAKFPKYEMKSAAIFDMFPQTPHIETVVELVRKKD
jgi:tRNA/tmRNA/rRNA uracil-C5-methylase (TrmA/RlmC/RlmD family)